MPGEDRLQTDADERVRLQKALRESEILRELADILNSSLDLEHILQALVRRTTELCAVARCAVWLLDEGASSFRPITYHVASPLLAEEIVQRAGAIWYRTLLAIDTPIIQRLLDAGGMLYIEDLRTEAPVQALAETFSSHSVLLVALTREGRPVGMLALDNPGQIGVFSPEQQQLARAIGQQATIAIDNARLYQQAQAQQRRAEQLIERVRGIYQVAMTVNSGEELSAVLRLATRNLVRGLDANDGLTLLLDTDGVTLRLMDQQETSYTLPVEGMSLDTLPHFHEAVATGQPLLINAEEAEEGETAWLHQFDLKNMLIVPLMVGAHEQGANWDLSGEQKSMGPNVAQVELLPDAHCVGLIVVNYTRRRKPSSGQYAFAQDIAAQCALAIEKARLLDTARQAAALANQRATTPAAAPQAMTERIMVLTPDKQIFIRNHTAANFLGVRVYSSANLHTFLQEHPHFTLDGRQLSYEEFPLTRALDGNMQVRGERLLSVRSDGVRRVIEITTTPLKDSKQKQIGVVGAFRDVTVQSQAEQSVHMALETFLHTAEAVSYSTDIYAILHGLLAKTLVTLACPRGTVHLFKQTEQRFELLLALGFGAEEETRWLAEQENWLNATHAQAAGFYQRIMSGHATLVHAKYSPGQRRRLEETIVLAAPITHNQHILGLLLLDRSHPMSEGAPRPTASSFTSWDLTIAEGIAQLAGLAMEQARWQQEAITARANEAAMRAADTLKDEFLAITAHEFRNPLAIIQGYSQNALRSLRKARGSEASAAIPSSVEDHLETIEAQAKQLNNIVTTFLDAARLDRGQIHLQMEAVDLEKVARQVVENLTSLVEQHELHCIAYPSPTPYMVQGDAARLSQIITNLVENAIKYSPLGGPVIVALSPGATPGTVKVCVEDRGMGIPKEVQGRLFERFYRVPSVDSQTRGVGLGLYIVAQLVQMHEGSMRVESSGIVGEGSRFLVTLPALSTPVKHAESAQTDFPSGNEPV